MARSQVWVWVVCGLYWMDRTHGSTTRMVPIVTDLDAAIQTGSSTSRLPDLTKVFPSKSDLPSGWSKLCNRNEDFVDTSYLKTLSVGYLKNIVQISCHIWETSDSLVFSSLREWMKTQKGSKFALRVTGHGNQVTGGTFHLPWPMKAENLVYLQVTGCNIKGYFSEYHSTDLLKISDELRVLDIKNSVIFFDLSKLHDLIKASKNISSDVECGPLTVEKFVFSNVTYWYDFENFDFSGNGTDLDLVGLADELLDNFEELNHICNYSSLRYIDESKSDTAGEIHFYLKHSKSRYPEVRKYNVSHLGMTRIPREFQTWRHHHPKLDYLDLSHNNISRINFTASESPGKSVGTIDLRYNSITHLSRDDLDTLQRLPTITINFRNNPFDCNCGIVEDLFGFLDRHSDLGTVGMGRYEYLRSLTCTTPPHLAGEMISNLSSADVYCRPPRVSSTVSGASAATVIVVPIVLVVSAVVVSFVLALIIRSYRSKRLGATSISEEHLVHQTKC